MASAKPAGPRPSTLARAMVTGHVTRSRFAANTPCGGPHPVDLRLVERCALQRHRAVGLVGEAVVDVGAQRLVGDDVERRLAAEVGEGVVDRDGNTAAPGGRRSPPRGLDAGLVGHRPPVGNTTGSKHHNLAKVPGRASSARRARRRPSNGRRRRGARAPGRRRRRGRSRRSRASRSSGRRARWRSPWPRKSTAQQRKSGASAATGSHTWAWRPVAWANRIGGPSPPRSWRTISAPSVEARRCTGSSLQEAAVSFGSTGDDGGGTCSRGGARRRQRARSGGHGQPSVLRRVRGADLDAMSELWEHSDRVMCTHPGWTCCAAGVRSAGRGWRSSSSPVLQFILTNEHVEVEGDTAWVSLDENILGDRSGAHRRRAQPVRPHADGDWKMVAHHGSGIFASQADDEWLAPDDPVGRRARPLAHRPGRGLCAGRPGHRPPLARAGRPRRHRGQRLPLHGLGARRVARVPRRCRCRRRARRAARLRPRLGAGRRPPHHRVARRHLAARRGARRPGHRRGGRAVDAVGTTADGLAERFTGRRPLAPVDTAPRRRARGVGAARRGLDVRRGRRHAAGDVPLTADAARGATRRRRRQPRRRHAGRSGARVLEQRARCAARYLLCLDRSSSACGPKAPPRRCASRAIASSSPTASPTTRS